MEKCGFQVVFWLWCRQFLVPCSVMGSNLGPQTGTSCHIGDGNRLEIKGTINVMLESSQPIPTPSALWKNCLPPKPSLVSNRLWSAGVWYLVSLASFFGWFFFSEHKTFSVLFKPFKFHLISIIADHVLNLKRNFSKYCSNFGRLVYYKSNHSF